MSLFIFVDAIFYGFLGIVLGFLLSWAYIKNKNKDIRKIIDFARIGKTILEIEDLSFDLVQLLSRISDCSEEIKTQLFNVRDIESNLQPHYNLEKIKNIGVKVDEEIQEK